MIEESKCSQAYDRFIAKATLRHNGRYKYLPCNYKQYGDPIKLICPQHGIRIVSDVNHLRKGSKGCPVCNREDRIERITLPYNELLERVHKGQNNRYTYPNIKEELKNTNSEITVVCPRHGMYKTKAVYLMNGNECKMCIKDNSYLTQDEFLRRSHKVHGTYYNYDKAIYSGYNKKVIITCPAHGDFSQTPHAHVDGQGCPKCAVIKNANKRRITLNEFLRRANSKHDYKYGYSDIRDIYSVHDVITINCPEHGPFTQKIYKHLNGSGCSKCSGKYKRTTEEYITACKEIYGNKYDLGRIVYINNRTYMEIGCPVHGWVRVHPVGFLSGSGCRICNTTIGENAVGTFLINNKIKYIQEYRVGNYRYDFYLPDLKALIEYDGKQHFVVCDFFGGEEALRKCEERDKKKNRLAMQMGLRLLRIKYTDIKIVASLVRDFISSIAPFYHNGEFFHNVLALYKKCNLPPDMNVSEVIEKYSFKINAKI